MILFKHDWYRFPSAVVHHQTSNVSFLRMAEIYKRMGVENYAFHLALHQPHLIGVNPHADDLPMEIKLDIGTECRYNPWYFFREVVRVPPQASQYPGQLRANRGNLALWWLFLNHIDSALIQPRQTGKSLSTDALMDWLLFIAAVNTRVNMLTKDEALRQANVDRLKNLRNYLPNYLVNVSAKDSDNKQEVTCVAYNNKYSTAVAQSSPSAAANVGRGLTAPIAHVDEGPFITHVDETIPAMLSAGNAARDEAEECGAPFGNIFTTTAGKKDSKSGRYMYDLIHGGMPWTERLLDCNDAKELRAIVEKNSGDNKPIVNCTFSHRQLGYTDEWLKKKMSESNSFGEAADRDYFNVWTAGGLSSPLSTELNELVRGSQKEPLHTEISKDYYILRWYIPKDEIAERMTSGKFIMGMDTSEAIGRDSISMVIKDVTDLSVVASATVNETNLIRFSAYVADLMIKYENIILIPERRSTGQTLIDTLLVRLPAAGIDPFKRIYNIVVDESHEYKDEYKQIQMDLARRPPYFYDKMKKYFGFTTAGSGKFSRGMLYSDVLQFAAKMGGAVVNDKTLIDEIVGLVVKNGRIDHSQGNHDDMVIAWLLGVWFLSSSKNLKYYGIEEALTRTKEYRGKGVIANLDPYEEMQQQQQNGIKKEIEQLLEDLRKSQDDIIAMQIENRIKTLDSRLSEQYAESSSIDALIKDANAVRNKRIRENIRQRNTGGQGMEQSNMGRSWGWGNTGGYRPF